jgi:hypothetical protein
MIQSWMVWRTALGDEADSTWWAESARRAESASILM